MSTGAERLRIAVAATIAGAAAVPVGAPAQAASHITKVTNFAVYAGANWKFAGTQAGPFATPGWGLADATYRGTFTVCTPSCHQLPDNVGNVFDGFGLVRVGSRVYDPPAGAVDHGEYVTSHPKRVSGLNVSVRHDLLGGRVLRTLVSLRNPMTHALRRNVSIGTNYGADASTDFDLTDLGTSSYVVYGTPAEAIVMLVHGDADGVTFDQVPGVNQDNEIETYPLRIGAGKTLRLLYFVVIGRDKSALTSDKSKFADGAALETNNYLVGLSNRVRHQVRNWNALPAD